MKKILPVLYCCCFCFSVINGQEIKLGIYGGLTIGRSVDNYHYAEDYTKGYIEGGWRQGIGIACLFENAYDLELLYYHQDTRVPTTIYISGNTFDEEFDLTIHWILLGFTAYLSKKTVKPFFGSIIGMGILKLREPSSNYQSSKTKFTWGGNLGVELSLRKLLSLKLKMDLLYSARLNNSETNSDIIAYNSYLQTGFSAGLIMRFKMRTSAK